MDRVDRDTLRKIFNSIDYDSQKTSLIVVNKNWCAALYDSAWFEWFERIVMEELNQILGASFWIDKKSKNTASSSRELEVYIDIDLTVFLPYASDYDSDASDYYEKAGWDMMDRATEDVMKEIKQILRQRQIDHDLSESPFWSSSQIDLKIELPCLPYDAYGLISNLTIAED